MKPINKYLIIFVLIVIMVSCAKAGKEMVLLEEKNAKVIKRGIKKYIDKYEKVFQIYSFGNLNFIMPTKIKIFKKNIFILDSEANCIYVFDKEGKFIRQIGKKGKGPGEFINLKDFCFNNNCIYCLDKGKESISKFNYLKDKLIFEQKIPGEITQNISLENLEYLKGKLFISGFIISNSNSILYSVKEDMKNVEKYFTLSPYISKLSFKNKLLKTINTITLDNNYMYIGFLIGNTLFCRFNMKKNICEYRVKINNNNTEIRQLIKGPYVEYITKYNLTNISICKDLIIVCEDAGGTSKKTDDKKNTNNISVYSKKGKYLFSLIDKSLPYSFYGLYCSGEIVDDKLYLYVVSPETSMFYKYIIKNISEKM